MPAVQQQQVYYHPAARPRPVAVPATAPAPGAALSAALVAGVAHEFRAPLASIKAYAEILRDETAPGSTAAAFLATIDREADYLVGLVDNLLNLERLAAGRLALDVAPVDVAALVTAAVAAYAPQCAERGLTPALALADALPLIRGDRDLLAVLVRNLVANAIKYNRPGGRVAVAARPAPGGVVLTVADEGPGVPPGEEDRIFTKFYRAAATRDAARGSGLGLYLVREIAALHGGAATLERTGPGGSRFAVTLRAMSAER
ncbi:MAG TPA: HAMP domain-containing sensor histidine kinase [Thermomicrobiales bacterium]|nr:HAMP domain-containing sensor histidine kinase [Thermomicrobiales bacterium]